MWPRRAHIHCISPRKDKCESSPQIPAAKLAANDGMAVDMSVLAFP